jgi:copper(I)-binding protein
MRTGVLGLLTAVVLVLPAAAQQVTVSGPWARATVTGQKTGAAYMSLTAPQADRLLGAETAAAASVEVHEHRANNGVMEMRQVAGGLALPAGSAVALAPGGYHLMMMGLKQPLAKGSSFPLTLVFEKAGRQTVTVTVEAAGASGPAGGAGGGAAMPEGHKH